MLKLMGNFLFYLIVAAVVLLPNLAAAGSSKANPAIAIIIDDMGDKLQIGKKAVTLPGKITYSFLPHAPHSKILANKAHAKGKEVMLHLPMETETGKQLGPGGLGLHMTEHELKTTTTKAVESIPHVKGVNNHMGSLLTRHPGAMEWFVQAVKAHGELYFVDSRTTIHTVARQIATEKDLPAASRDVFLDHVRDRKAIRAKFARLLKLAKKHGTAIGIGHPYPETLAVLKKELSKLGARGVRLVPVSQIVTMQQGSDPRQRPLSRSQMVARRLQSKQ
jgi:polysaccharide deacetylase 2 family uncharacterized protein YibQ